MAQKLDFYNPHAPTRFFAGFSGRHNPSSLKLISGIEIASGTFGENQNPGGHQQKETKF
jgi:hypothetical protein